MELTGVFLNTFSEGLSEMGDTVFYRYFLTRETEAISNEMARSSRNSSAEKSKVAPVLSLVV